MDEVIEVWDKYWPQTDKGDRKAIEAVEALCERRGVKRDQVTVERVMRPERLVVTIRNADKESGLRHDDVAEEVRARRGLSGRAD